MAYSQGSRQCGEQPNQDQRSVGGDQQHGQSSDNCEFDPGYYEWRSEQMRTLDREYRTWLQGGSKVFSDEFMTWHERRKSGKQVERKAEHDPLEHDDAERAPDDQGNAITSQEQNENVAQRALDQEENK